MFDFNDDVERVPLIQFDFEHLSEEEEAFAALYDIPLALVKALSMVLKEQPSHQAKQVQFQLDTCLNNLTEVEKDTLLRALFEQGQLTRHQALALTRKADENYHWLTPKVISFIEQAQSHYSKSSRSARKKISHRKSRKRKSVDGYLQSAEHYWQQAKEQADRTSPVVMMRHHAICISFVRPISSKRMKRRLNNALSAL